MTPEKDQALVRDFPHLFGDRYSSITQSCFGFGFECNDGWESLIRHAAEKLEPLIVQWVNDRIKNDELDQLDFMPRASQIKEKFGGLRFYLTSGTDEMWDIVAQAEKESESVCEDCGEPGELRGEAWYYTRCDVCWKKLQEERYGTPD
jgi:hypothetical protein